MKEARYYKRLENDTVQCSLCPHYCLIEKDKKGKCGVRKNSSGFLFSENYKMISSFSFDPIEKKPLYHFYPGQEILSIGTIGCNLNCNFCQNCSISQEPFQAYSRFNLDLEDIIEAISKNKNNIGIAFTYNEPTVWHEYIVDISKSIDKSNKKLMVSNGFINPEPLNELFEHIDAFNIDLKAFSDEFYKNETDSSIEPVKNTLKAIVKAGKHLEITNLIIPGKNDDKELFKEMVQWIKTELGKEIPLHLSKYFPHYKSSIEETSLDILIELSEIAKKELDHVYIGNVKTQNSQNTYCPNCKSELISRTGYFTVLTELEEGKCRNCGHKVNIISN